MEDMDNLDERLNRAVESVIRRCKCGTVIRFGQTQCKPCKNAYMRANRRTYTEFSAEQKMKANARSTLKMSVRRGATVKGPCAVCGTDIEVQAHHEDYTKPLDVVWLCKQHHDDRTFGGRVPVAAIPKDPEKLKQFHVALKEAVWLLMLDGMNLSTILWTIRKEAVGMAIKKHGTKKLAALALRITPQTLWNIENDHHK